MNFLLTCISFILVLSHTESINITLNGVIIPNFGYVRFSDIGTNAATALLCNTNRPANIPVNPQETRFNSGGEWFTSDGSIADDLPEFRRNRGHHVVRLIRKSTATSTPPEGIYYCQIEDDTLTNHTLYVIIGQSSEPETG